MTAAVQPDLFEVTEAPSGAGSSPAPACDVAGIVPALRPTVHHLPSLEEQQAATVAHDALVCVCGHKCESHGSYTKGVFQGVGDGQCGWDDYPGPCPCGRFEETL